MKNGRAIIDSRPAFALFAGLGKPAAFSLSAESAPCIIVEVHLPTMIASLANR